MSASRAASPAAASASCHSESTRAQPSACVMTMYLLPSSRPAGCGSDRAPEPWRVWIPGRTARALPQHAQDLELRVCWSALRHRLTMYEVVRTYTGRVPEVSGL